VRVRATPLAPADLMATRSTERSRPTRRTSPPGLFHGGKALVLTALLGREPLTVEAYIDELARA
jgi:hypothetical protein